MDNITFKGGTIDEVVAEAFKVTEAVANQAAVSCSDKAAKKAVSLLRSAIGGSGKYSRGWKVKKEKDGAIVYNASQPSLTHLLENGHDIIKNGQKVGQTRSIPHISVAEEFARRDFEKLITEEIQRRLS